MAANILASDVTVTGDFRAELVKFDGGLANNDTYKSKLNVVYFARIDPNDTALGATQAGVAGVGTDKKTLTFSSLPTLTNTNTKTWTLFVVGE